MRKFVFLMSMSFVLYCIKASIVDLTFLRYSPNKPFNYLIDSSKRITADKVHYKIFGNYGDIIEGDNYIRHSDDGLTDVIVTSDNEITISYDKKGRLVRYISPINDMDETYTYTEDGKLLSISSEYSNLICYYTNTGVDSLVKWDEHPYYGNVRSTKEIVTYGSNGYTKAFYTYVVERADYVFDGEEKYEFNEDGCIVFIDNLNDDNDVRYFYSKDMVEEITGNHTKQEYYFDGNNDCVKQMWYKWSPSGYWYLWNAFDWIYYYYEVSTDDIGVENYITLSTSKGKICIDNINASDPIVVADMFGRIIVNSKLPEGRNIISINSSGVYIVRKGSFTQKVFCP